MEKMATLKGEGQSESTTKANVVNGGNGDPLAIPWWK
jgi:hypothetical protein